MMRVFVQKHTLCAVLLMAVLLGLAACGVRPAREAEQVTVGIPWLEQHALLFVAEEQGFFAQNGLAVTLKPYDSGPAAMDALARSQVDIAGTSEYPMVRAVFNKQPIQVLTCVDHFENDFIVARKGQGIVSPEDLKGKRIGLAQGTINAFYLGRFLAQNGIGLEEVTQVNLPPDRFVQSITSGEVDALIAWQPYIYQIQQAAPEVATWPAQGNQQIYGLLVGRDDWLAAHPETAVRFLKALAQAEDFLDRSPEKARAIVQKRLNYSDAYITTVWADHQFALTMEHSLIVAMTDEARWMMKNQLTAETQTPDFLTTIYVDAMRVVKPDATEVRP